MNGWQVLSAGLAGCRAFVLSFPLCGNGFYKPLDSGLRRNDNGGETYRLGNNVMPATPSFMDTPTGMQVVERRLPAAGKSGTDRRGIQAGDAEGSGER